MKKTSATALTAAVFAAALNFIPETGSTANAAFNDQNPQVAMEQFVTPITTMPVTVPLYGPPWMFTDAPQTDDTTYTTTVQPVPTTINMATLYGPPWAFTTSPYYDEDTHTEPVTTTVPVRTKPAHDPDDPVIAEINENLGPLYGPQPYFGDINGDNMVNTYDLVYARKLIVSPPDEDNAMVTFPLVWAGDLNHDGVFSVADIVLLNKFLEGGSNDNGNQQNDDQEIRTTVPEEQNTNGTTTTTTTIPAPLYGPPWVFGLE